MKKLNLYSWLFFLLVFFILLPAIDSAKAAYLKFDPSQAHKEIDEQFEVSIIVNTDAKKILGVDARIEYDASVLEIVGINDGSFLTVAHKEYDNGRAYVGAVVDDPASEVEGEGVIASIVFLAKQDGYSDITFICELGETANDSNIPESSVDANDIIECGQNGKSIITVGTGVAPSQIPGQGGQIQPGGQTATPPSRLPDSGIMDHVFTYVIIGLALVAIGWGVKLVVL